MLIVIDTGEDPQLESLLLINERLDLIFKQNQHILAQLGYLVDVTDLVHPIKRVTLADEP